MDITSFEFGLFFLISIIVYWIIPLKHRWIVLLLASIAFFLISSNPWTIIYLAVSIISVYFASNYFEQTRNDAEKKRARKTVLIMSVILNVAILTVLKYSNFFIGNVNRFLPDSSKWSFIHLAAPIGISFYTLQLIAYLSASYYGVTRVETNIGKLALFTCYFPQMVSGPISRHKDIGDQLNEGHEFDYDNVTGGLRRIAWGLVKKLAISNRLAVLIDYMWDNPQTFSGLWIWVAAFGFCIQLYADFSGCMDIVLGVSRCFGIVLPENFNAPFLSKSIQEFWNRWHITLGLWLRDYIMNPLLKSKKFIRIGEWSRAKFGKKRGRKIPTYIAMFVLWTLMGIWHGDSWKYIVGEGWWFWAVIVLSSLLEPEFEKIKGLLRIRDENVFWKAFQVIRTWFIFSVGMLFFRADSFIDGINRIKMGLAIGNISAISDLMTIREDVGGKVGALVLLTSMLLLVLQEIVQYKKEVSLYQVIEGKRRVFRYAFYYITVFLILLSLNIGNQEFIYAQF